MRGARSRRQVRQPAWLEEYEVQVPPCLPSRTAGNVTAREEGNGLNSERHNVVTNVEMMPPTLHTMQYASDSSDMQSSHSGCEDVPAPGYMSTPVAQQYSGDILCLLQQMKEEFRRLHSTVMDMKQQMEGRSEPLMSAIHSPSPEYMSKHRQYPWQL